MRRLSMGFTLVELVMVIVILGILAAFAVPRFLSLDSKARAAAVQSLGGSLRSAAALARGMAMAAGQTGPTGTITMEGVTVNLVFGYPAATATGMQAALQDTSGFTISAGPPLTFVKSGATGATPANCNVTYAAAASSGVPPTITVSSTLGSDC